MIYNLLRNNKFEFFLFLLTAISVIGLSFFVPMFQDDYYYSGDLQRNNVLSFMWRHYVGFDGRFLTIQTFLQSFMIKYLHISIVISVYSVFFIMLSVFNVQYITKEYQISEKKRIVLVILGILLLFYGFRTHISETLYWKVGGYYTLMIFIVILWVSHISSAFQTNKIRVLLFVLSFFAGAISQNVIVALLFFYIISFYEHRKTKLFWLYLSFLIAGALVISVTPGTFKRIEMMNKINDNTQGYDIKTLIKNGLYLSNFYISLSKHLFAASLLFGMIIYQCSENNSKATIKDIIKSFNWLIMAFLTILPMTIVIIQATPRTSIFFMTFASIFIVKFTIQFLSFIEFKKIKFTDKIFSLFVSVLIICHLLIVYKHSKVGANAIDIQRRNEALILQQKNNGKRIVYIKEELMPLKAFTIHYSNVVLARDTNFWLNSQYSSYYGVKISTEERLQP